ncbi:MAG TPA: cobyrinate a,c-diamide synthase [Ferrovibrio sp.]|uniref:cobyrinate a,c-diamide synthase n=1 Tax=Ferrovibrio sp. TaxID=1917215 RepID=UPI002B4B01EA|nr:cobyrinate a,c-diamide synthase [Ferrovibrio sp.]HLT77976.1 cobyrinate a,c-diamide synthase [Ferrovibrio sp.]
MPRSHLTHGVVIAAPASGSGKTLVTLALIHLLSREGRVVAPFKTGPDYIDGAYHRAASAGRPCFNLDLFAMRPETIAAILHDGAADAAFAVIEGVMGLFDGAADAEGSTADLAARLGLPVILVIDASHQGQSAAALAHGFRSFRADVRIGGVILNRVASERHERLLREAFAPLGLPVLAALPAHDDLVLPSRHLGLVQADEHGGLDLFLDRAADWLHRRLDRAAFKAIATPLTLHTAPLRPLPPPGQRIAVASDAAFAFAYPHLLQGWRRQGAELSVFSPLQDEAPAGDADAVFLPGGYPELHADKLAGNARLMQGLRDAAARGAAIYGECGGFMLLGESLTDADGARHAMAGLLPVATSFAARRRSLGYRRITALGDTPLGAKGSRFRGHEFHYSVQTKTAATPLFAVSDASGDSPGVTGAQAGRVFGSYLHLIDRED